MYFFLNQIDTSKEIVFKGTKLNFSMIGKDSSGYYFGLDYYSEKFHLDKNFDIENFLTHNKC